MSYKTVDLASPPLISSDLLYPPRSIFQRLLRLLLENAPRQARSSAFRSLTFPAWPRSIPLDDESAQGIQTAPSVAVGRAGTRPRGRHCHFYEAAAHQRPGRAGNRAGGHSV